MQVMAGLSLFVSWRRPATLKANDQQERFCQEIFVAYLKPHNTHADRNPSIKIFTFMGPIHGSMLPKRAYKIICWSKKYSGKKSWGIFGRV